MDVGSEPNSRTCWFELNVSFFRKADIRTSAAIVCFEPTLIDAAKCLNGRNAHKTEFAKFGVSA